VFSFLEGDVFFVLNSLECRRALSRPLLSISIFERVSVLLPKGNERHARGRAEFSGTDPVVGNNLDC
jgi:hypothetical protein